MLAEILENRLLARAPKRPPLPAFFSAMSVTARFKPIVNTSSMLSTLA
jgi:hypothetical protein